MYNFANGKTIEAFLKRSGISELENYFVYSKGTRFFEYKKGVGQGWVKIIK